MIYERLSGNGGVDMSAREVKLFEIQISHKFSSIEEAQKVVNACVNFIRYQVKQRHYFCQAIIGVSQLKSDNIVAIRQEQTNLEGRTITQRVFNNLEIVGNKLQEIESIPIQKQPHIHCLVLSSPGEMFAEMIVDYLAKKLDTTDSNGDKTKVRKMPVNLNMTEYVFKQIENPRFPDFRFSEAMNYIPNDITFRRLYEFYRKKSAMMHNDDLKPLTYNASRKIQDEYERL